VTNINGPNSPSRARSGQVHPQDQETPSLAVRVTHAGRSGGVLVHRRCFALAVAQAERNPSTIEAQFKREERVVLGWRFEELVRAGYDERDAMIIADRGDIDLHRATELLRAGCTKPTAMRILL
jgi:hypothetical protein